MKINLKNVKDALSRDEMRIVSGGTGSGKDCTCSATKDTCSRCSKSCQGTYFNGSYFYSCSGEPVTY